MVENVQVKNFIVFILCCAAHLPFFLSPAPSPVLFLSCNVQLTYLSSYQPLPPISCIVFIVCCAADLPFFLSPAPSPVLYLSCSAQLTHLSSYHPPPPPPHLLCCIYPVVHSSLTFLLITRPISCVVFIL